MPVQVVLRSYDPIFDRYDPPAVGQASFMNSKQFATGTMLLRPDFNEYTRLLALLGTVDPTFDDADMVRACVRSHGPENEEGAKPHGRGPGRLCFVNCRRSLPQPSARAQGQWRQLARASGPSCCRLQGFLNVVYADFWARLRALQPNDTSPAAAEARRHRLPWWLVAWRRTVRYGPRHWEAKRDSFLGVDCSGPLVEKPWGAKWREQTK